MYALPSVKGKTPALDCIKVGIMFEAYHIVLQPFILYNISYIVYNPPPIVHGEDEKALKFCS